MPRSFVAVSALSAADLATRFDAAFASLLTTRVVGLALAATDEARRNGVEWRATATTDTALASTLTTPFRLKVFEGNSLSTAKAALDAFVAANPTYFISGAFEVVITGARRTTSAALAVAYNTSSTASVNWVVDGASSGAPAPLVRPAASGAVSIPVASVLSIYQPLNGNVTTLAFTGDIPGAFHAALLANTTGSTITVQLPANWLDASTQTGGNLLTLGPNEEYTLGVLYDGTQWVYTSQTRITSSLISDATAAGRAMLTSASAAAQADLLGYTIPADNGRNACLNFRSQAVNIMGTPAETTVWTPPAGEEWLLLTGIYYIEAWAGTAATAAVVGVKAGTGVNYLGNAGGDLTLPTSFSGNGHIVLGGSSLTRRPLITSTSPLIVKLTTAMSGGGVTGPVNLRLVGSLIRVK